MDATTRLSGDGRRVLAGRYVVRGRLGQGGMADVELAHDEVLDREVAVKLLHQRYANDQSFLDRFRREARAAASLNHPNMVAVYDSGEDDGRPFIVMEYVAGRSLRELLQAERVTPRRAAEMTADAALALHYAHERGLVHRDVKPANIMLSDEGQVKVTDFGIARAVNADTITQTAAVFGTAAYVSPEQAQGKTVDRRTDIYSLGVVLYEMLVGRQPFEADSAVGLAYKHVSEQPPPPRELNPDVSPELEAVVLTAMAKNPDDRYPDARAFHDDLQRILQGMGVSVSPAAAYAATQALGTSPTMVATEQRPATVYEETDDRRGGRWWAWVLLALLLLALLGLGAYYLLNSLGGDPEPPRPTAPAVTLVTVPDVVGERLDDARNTLDDAELQVEVERQPDDAPRNEVLESDPAPDTEVEENAVVTLTVSDGPATTGVPGIVGLTEEEALAELQEADLEVGTREEARSDDFDAGTVIDQDPAEGDEVEEGQAVDYVVTTGPETIEVPDLFRIREENVENNVANALADQGFTDEVCGGDCLFIEFAEAFSDDIGEGRTIDQEPGVGSRVEPGSTIAVVISLGPEETEDPEPPPDDDPEEPTEVEETPQPTEETDEQDLE